MRNKIGISLNIDVTKIDKEKLFVGAKGKYLNATVFVNPAEDQYGKNGMITQNIGKDQKGPILGNCKIFWEDQAETLASKAPEPQPQTPAPKMDELDDDVPF